MEVNCESMAVIAATLANGGTCPITRDPIIKPEHVRDVLSLLHSCGFYEYSGQFAFRVNLPLLEIHLNLWIHVRNRISDWPSWKIQQSWSHDDGFAKHHGHLYLLPANGSIRKFHAGT